MQKKKTNKNRSSHLTRTNGLNKKGIPAKKFALWKHPGKWKSSLTRIIPHKRNNSPEKTIIQLFEEQVNKKGDRVAVIGRGNCGDGGGSGDCVDCGRTRSNTDNKVLVAVTYKELNEKSNDLAQVLLAKGVGPDVIVCIMMDRSLEMIIALLGIWKAGGAYLPIDPNYPEERINYILADSGAKLLVIRNNKEAEKVGKWEGELLAIANGANGPEDEKVRRWEGERRGIHHSKQLAYIIYTSGSTGQPKGILVEHRNLAAYLNAFSREFKFTPRDIVLQQASYTFDIFVEEVYAVLISGGVVAIAGKQTGRDIDLLLEFIEKYNVTVLDCVPLLLNELNTYCAAEPERKRLRTVHTFISGGDVLKYRHINNLFKSGKVYNTYGPTETTVCATYYRCSTKRIQLSLAVPIGKPITGYHVYIMDANGKPAHKGVVGELCISGAGVARGYLNQPELTAEKFNQYLRGYQYNQAKKNKNFLEGKRVYHTGDLGFKLRGGNIVYMGRMDFQVKVRGIRIELKEIEAHLDAHPGIREATVTAREDENGDKYLAAYAAPISEDTHLDARSLREYLATKLPEYMIPSSFVILDRMPLTPVGKLDHWALMALSGSDEDDAAIEAGITEEFSDKTRGNTVQETLTRIWQKILKIKKIGIYDNFFQLGGHSLRVMKVISEIRSRLDVPVRGTDLFKRPTIKELSDFILSLEPGVDKKGVPPLEAVEKKEYYPASSLQKQFYILDRMEDIGIAYNIPDVKVLNGEISTEQLEGVCRLLIERHESLRTSFQLSGEELMQRVHAPGEIVFHMPYFDIDTGPNREDMAKDKIKIILQGFVQPFSLDKAPLFRACLVKLTNEKYLFFYDMHHIIADGMSTLIMEHELIQLLEGCKLPGLSIQYKDFSQWQNRLLKEGRLKKQEDYWLSQFWGEIPVLNLPLDYPAPTVQSFAGDALNFKLRNESHKKLNEAMKKSGVTLYMFLLAVFNILLEKYSGQEDIVVGSPIAGRTPGRNKTADVDDTVNLDLGNIIGLFINIMTLRNFPVGVKTFKQFLDEVKENVLNAFENQEYPYGELIEKLALKKDLSKNPLFSAELVVHNMEISSEAENMKPGVVVNNTDPNLCDFGYDMKISQVDMTLVVEEYQGEIDFNFIYCTHLFKRETIERFARHFTRLLDYFQANPNARITGAIMLSDEEKRQILWNSNGNETPISTEQYVYCLIEKQVKRTPDSISVTGSNQITYDHLNERALRLAGLLIKKGILADGMVGIMMGRSVEMFIGLLGIWKAGGAYLPIDPEYPQYRIEYMLKDSSAKLLVIDNDKEAEKVRRWEGELLAIANGANGLEDEKVRRWEGKKNPFNLAYIIYTSGSTGRPKGVLVEHRNLAAYLTAFRQEFNISVHDIVLQQASYTFDAFAEEVYPVLIAGGKLAVPAMHEVTDIRLLTNFIVRQSVTVIDCSPLLLNELNKRLAKEALRIHLPAFTFISGGDILKREYIDRLFALGTIYNTYGPTESTVCASYYCCTAEVGALPPIGKPIANYGLYILDKTDGLVPVGVAGEMVITGPGVTRGYLNQPELMNKSFFRGSRGPHGARGAGGLLEIWKKATPAYRTGDLAKWLPDGAIVFLGRIDSQVKIRGYRIELAEIEAQLVKHPEIKESVVIVREDKNGDKTPCAYVVGPTVPPGLREFLSRCLPVYMIPAYFTAIDKIPLTSSGKIDHKALSEQGRVHETKEFIAPGNLLEEKLAEIWATILGIEKGKISTNANFFHLGGHSLKAAQMVMSIQNEMGAEISMVEVFKNSSIRGLAQAVKNSGKKSFTPLAAAEKKEYYHLSPAQKRMYFLQQWEPDSPGYNVSDAVNIAGEVNPRHIEDIFQKLIRRHESFRTSFHMRDREAVQKIHEEVEFKIEYLNLATGGIGGTGGTDSTEVMSTKDKIYHSSLITHHFIHSFDLSQAPLLRVGLAEIAPGQHLLLMDMHHIISDGISLYLLGKEFTALYKGEELPPLKFQYKDYAAWKNQRIELRETEIKTQEKYWLKQFEDHIPILTLPQDYPRPAVKNFKGQHINFRLDKVPIQRFYDMAAQKNVTLYILLLAVFNIFISRLSGGEDIVAGTPVAGRRHHDLRQIIGMFVNTLALRNFPVGEKSFFAFLKEVKGNFLESLENQDYEFEELVEKLGVTRDASRNPLFDIMFTLRSAENQQGTSPHPEIQDMPPSYEYSHRVARFDLILLVVEDADDLFFTLEYSTELFKEETAARFVHYLKMLTASILTNPDRKLSEFELMTPEEKQDVLYGFNNAPPRYPGDKTIPGLFEEYVQQAGDRIALAAWETHETYESPVCVTYRELNEQAGKLAGLLIEKGVVPDTIIAVMAERSIEMIIGILGILKSGGAYLPIDPGYPEERIGYMLKDSGTKILINKFESQNPKFETNSNESNPNDPNKKHNFEIPLVLNFEHLNLDIVSDFGFRVSDLNPSNLAYIIYTSGSTGRPKGVLTTHANVIRIVKNPNYIELTGADRLLQLSNYAFDGSVFDIYGALLNLSVLVLPGKKHVSSVPGLAGLIQKEKITVFFVTTALFNTMVDGALEAFENIRQVLFGGERVSVEHVEKAFAYLGKDRVLHMYGPTETTVFASYYCIVEKKERCGSIPIGKPVTDTSIYILDSHMNPCPIGIVGELNIGGGGAARGYLNKPELTHEKFDQDLWDKKDDQDESGVLRTNFHHSSFDIPRTHHSKFYRTGDLGRWLPGGNIEYIARKDQQVKIRGFRIEIGEIESQLLKHEAVKESFVMVREKKGDNYLCAYYILKEACGEKPGPWELKQFLAQSLPAYMVPAYFVAMEKFPLSPNGKLDKKLLPGPDMEELAGVYVAPRDELEEKLVGIWSEVLGMDSGIIGINSNFFQLGGHSLKAIVMADKIQTSFNVKILLSDLFQRQTIEEMAEYIVMKKINRETCEPETIEVTEVREYYPLTPEQERMFDLHRFYGFGNRIFNMPWVGELEVKDEENLEKAFWQLIERHESLRTSFLLVDGKPVQVVHKQVPFKIEYLDLSSEDIGGTRNVGGTDNISFYSSFIIRHFIRAFDLSKAPLLRVGVAKKQSDKLLLIIDMHHIVSDGSSFGILIRELKALLEGNILSPLRVQYKDYVQWQGSEKRKMVLAKQEAYWMDLLSKPAPGLALPVDFPRPAVRGMAADVIDFELDIKVVKALKNLSKRENCSFFMVMLALFNVFLFKLTGREDILVSTFFAGRRNSDLRKMVGMFVNTLLMRNYPSGEKPFSFFLNEVKQQTLCAYENQDYSRERLMKKMTFIRQKPLPVDVNFVLQNMDPLEKLMSGFQIFQSAWPIDEDEKEPKVSFYDLRFEGFELEERLIFNVEYDINLFKEETIARFISDFKNIVSAVLDDPGKKISELI